MTRWVDGYDRAPQEPCSTLTHATLTLLLYDIYSFKHCSEFSRGLGFSYVLSCMR